MNRKTAKIKSQKARIGQLGRKIQQLNSGLKSVHKTTSLLTSPMELKQVLEIIVRTVTDALNLDAAGLRLLDKDTGQLILKATYGLSSSYINKGPVTATESELNMQALHGEAIIIEDMRQDPNFKRYHNNVVEEGIVSSLSIGLLYREKGIGILRLYSKKPRKFSPADISLARTIADQSAAAITNARLYEGALQGQRMAQQMKMAGYVQRHLIPKNVPQIMGMELAGVYVPCHDVGGDFYDFISLEDGRFVLAIGDAMGKGMPASLTMASLRASLRAFAQTSDNLQALIQRVNRMISQDIDVGEFATLFCGELLPCCACHKFAELKQEIHAELGRSDLTGDDFCACLTYCNCGHEPPILIRDGQVINLSEGGTVLGLDTQSEYETHRISLISGDMLIFYTDGLSDAVNFRRDSFGRERIIQAALDSVEMSAEQTVKNILWLMRKYTGLTERFDDTAVVVLKVPRGSSCQCDRCADSE